MSKMIRTIVLLVICVVAISMQSGTANAAITSVTQMDIPNHINTLDAGSGGQRKMLLFNISADSPTTLSKVSVWLEGANLESQGAAFPDGYKRGVKSIALYKSDATGALLSLAFGGALTNNTFYSADPSGNPIKAYSNYVWGEATIIFLNLLGGDNYYILVYDFDAPNFQPVGATRTIAGERYNIRLDYLQETGVTPFIANIMGPYLIVTGTIVGSTFAVDKLKYFDRDQVGIPVDPVVIGALTVTASGMNATWNDLLIRAYGTGNDTRVARIFIYEDTTGEGVFTPPSIGPPNDTLVDTIDIPFTADNGQCYRIFPTSIVIPANTKKTFFFCYDFDPNAPDPTNNEFGFSVVNFGGSFGIITPFDLTTLVAPKVRLLPLPPGVQVTIGEETPDTGFVYDTPLLTQRWEMLQVKITAIGMDVLVSNLTFQWTQLSTGRQDTLFSLEVWMDANNSNRGFVDSTDVLLASLTRSQILASPNFFRFSLVSALSIPMNTTAYVLLVAIFTDQAQNAYSFAMFGDGVAGNFTYVRFHPITAPLFSGYLVFVTSPPVSPTPTPTPTPTVTVPLPNQNDGGSGGAIPNPDVGVGDPGSIYKGEGGGCFVASAAFGSMIEQDVQILCNLRDNSLAYTQASCIVALYYRVGPSISDFIRSAPAARSLVREHLTSFLQSAK